MKTGVSFLKQGTHHSKQRYGGSKMFILTRTLHMTKVMKSFGFALAFAVLASAGMAQPFDSKSDSSDGALDFSWAVKQALSQSLWIQRTLRPLTLTIQPVCWM